MMNDIAQGRVGCGIYTADVVMRDNYMVKDRISELVRNIGGNPDDASADNAVRVAPNPIVSNESGLMMWLVAGVFGVLFMFCGYLLIYNVFEIAVTNDIRQYGLLRTVGTTSRQSAFGQSAGTVPVSDRHAIRSAFWHIAWPQYSARCTPDICG